MYRSELLGVGEKVRFGARHPFVVLGLTRGARLFVLLWVCILCLHRAKAAGPLSHSVIVDFSCHVGCQCAS